MSDLDALVRGVLAAPDEDTPRLVLADELDAHGNAARAEFIRAQCWLAARGYGVESPLPADDAGLASWATRMAAHDPAEVHKVQSRSDSLVAEHGDSWVPHVSAMWGWERGFVGFIRGITAADWLAHADAILAAHPVRRVRLTTMPSAGLNTGVVIIAAGYPVTHVRHTALDPERMPSGRRTTVEWALSQTWPGVTFELPPVAAAERWVADPADPIYQMGYRLGRVRELAALDAFLTLPPAGDA